MRILCFIQACLPKVASGFGDKDMRLNKVNLHEGVGGFGLFKIMRSRQRLCRGSARALRASPIGSVGA